MAVGSQIREHDQHWAWKFVIRLLLTIFCIVAIGMIAYLVAPSTVSDPQSVGAAVVAWIFIPLGLSVVWSCVSIPVLFARKRPVHPGFNVAFDLILSLALGVAAGILTALAVVSLYDQYYDYSSSYNNSSYYYDDYNQPSGGPGYSGFASSDTYYDIRNNLSYVYTSTTGRNQTRAPGSVNYLCPNYDSCADQSAADTAFTHVLNISLAAGIILCIASLLQFILFVWACIDCHAYNRRAVYDHRARELADKMIAEMRSRGELPPLPSTGYQQQTQQVAPQIHSDRAVSSMMSPAFAPYHGLEIAPVGSPGSNGPNSNTDNGYQTVQQHIVPDYLPDTTPRNLSVGSNGMPPSGSPISSRGQQPQIQVSRPITHIEY